MIGLQLVELFERDWEGVALLKEVCYLGWALSLKNLHHSELASSLSRCKFSVPAPVPCQLHCCQVPYHDDHVLTA